MVELVATVGACALNVAMMPQAPVERSRRPYAVGARALKKGFMDAIVGAMVRFRQNHESGLSVPPADALRRGIWGRHAPFDEFAQSLRDPGSVDFALHYYEPDDSPMDSGGVKDFQNAAPKHRSICQWAVRSVESQAAGPSEPRG